MNPFQHAVFVGRSVGGCVSWCIQIQTEPFKYTGHNRLSFDNLAGIHQRRKSLLHGLEDFRGVAAARCPFFGTGSHSFNFLRQALLCLLR